MTSRIPPMMRGRRHVIVSLGFLLACSIPTGDMCGCPPAVSTVLVTGRVRTAQNVPVRRAVLEFSGVPVTSADTASFARSSLVSGTPTLADTLGVFRTRLLSPTQPGPYVLRMRAISSDGRDTTSVSAGTVRFAQQGTKEDSLYFVVTVP